MRRNFYSSAALQVLEKAIRLPVSLIMSILVANYLGAEQFGALTVAHTVVLIAAPIASLGLDEIVYQRLGNDRDPSQILSTAILLRLGGFVLTYLVLLIYSFGFSGGQVDRAMVLTIGLILACSAFNPINMFLTVRGFGKVKVLIGLAAFAFISVFRLSLIMLGADLYMFALAYLVETLTMALLLTIYARRNGIGLSPRFVDSVLVRELMRAAFPLLLSHSMINVFTKIDILMIQHFLGDAPVGQYAVAIRLVEVIAIFPAIVISALFPIAMTAKRDSQTEYFRVMNRILTLGYVFGVAAAMSFFFFGGWLVRTLYSEEFTQSADLLQVLCWAFVFQFFGSFSTLWMVNEGLQRYRVYRIAAAMVLNVCLNLIWIPAYGISGAAYATLLSHFLSSILGNAFTAHTRPIFWLQVRVLLTFGLLQPRAQDDKRGA